MFRPTLKPDKLKSSSNYRQSFKPDFSSKDDDSDIFPSKPLSMKPTVATNNSIGKDVRQQTKIS